MIILHILIDFTHKLIDTSQGAIGPMLIYVWDIEQYITVKLPFILVGILFHGACLLYGNYLVDNRGLRWLQLISVFAAMVCSYICLLVKVEGRAGLAFLFIG